MVWHEISPLDFKKSVFRITNKGRGVFMQLAGTLLHSQFAQPVNNFVANLVPKTISDNLPSMPTILSSTAHELGPIAASVFTAYQAIEAIDLCLKEDRDLKKVGIEGGKALAVFLATILVLNRPGDHLQYAYRYLLCNDCARSL